ncbi:MAG: L-threonylcarbamoyladenylate synthase [Spirochaetota bacterium]
MIRPIAERTAIADCARVIRDGGVAIIPTDTVYGFAADAFNENAVERIYRIKGREKNKPFLVLIPDTAAIGRFSDMPLPEELRAKVPGAITFILPLTERVSLSYVSGTIALRVPDDAFLRELLALSGPIVAPSANGAGAPLITSVRELVKRYEEKVDIIIDGGDIVDAAPSTIYDCIGKRVLRQGKVRV